MPSPSDPVRDFDPARALNSMMDLPQMYLSMIDTWRRMAANAVGLSGSEGPFRQIPGTKGAPDPSAMLSYVSQSYMMLMDSAQRCWNRWTQIHMRYVSMMGVAMSSMGSGAAQDPRGQAEMMDNMRAYMRELLEMLNEECQRATMDLQKLDLTMLPTAADGEHPRRWKAKS